jgi:hypothetical protein
VKYTLNEDGTLDVYLRQSWINDAMMCNERGRNAILRPEWSKPNDATILGTAVHAGIAAVLEGKGEPIPAALNELNRLLDEPFQRVKYTNEELFDHVPELIREWEKNIAPTLGNVVAVEKSFTFPLGTMQHFVFGTIRLWGIGTIDCVTDTAIWDWKTSGKKYNAREKQSQAIQPTMYTAAAVHHGWLEWPATFKYGVLVRGGSAQIVPIHRNESHVEWLQEVAQSFVRLFASLGTDEAWTRNDTHYLCSSTWCPFWSVCKGSKLAPADIEPQEGKK